MGCSPFATSTLSMAVNSSPVPTLVPVPVEESRLLQLLSPYAVAYVYMFKVSETSEGC